jgi:4'-phosphopantetheinyl transferase
MYAFTCKHEVGIDLERIRSMENLLEVARQQLSSLEYTALRGLPESLQHEAFYAYWTCKEAYLKARGMISMKEFDISVEPGRAPKLLRDRIDTQMEGRWSFIPINVGTGWQATAAVSGEHPNLKYWKIGYE